MTFKQWLAAMIGHQQWQGKYSQQLKPAIGNYNWAIPYGSAHICLWASIGYDFKATPETIMTSTPGYDRQAMTGV